MHLPQIGDSRRDMSDRTQQGALGRLRIFQGTTDSMQTLFPSLWSEPEPTETSHNQRSVSDAPAEIRQEAGYMYREPAMPIPIPGANQRGDSREDMSDRTQQGALDRLRIFQETTDCMQALFPSLWSEPEPTETSHDQPSVSDAPVEVRQAAGYLYRKAAMPIPSPGATQRNRARQLAREPPTFFRSAYENQRVNMHRPIFNGNVAENGYNGVPGAENYRASNQPPLPPATDLEIDR